VGNRRPGGRGVWAGMSSITFETVDGNRLIAGAGFMFDIPAWLVGRQWCHAGIPNCVARVFAMCAERTSAARTQFAEHKATFHVLIGQLHVAIGRVL
jgi:hypothetical protein